MSTRPPGTKGIQPSPFNPALHPNLPLEKVIVMWSPEPESVGKVAAPFV